MDERSQRIEETTADLRLAAAKAWCVVKFPYDHPTQEQVENHVIYDARSTAEEPWLIEAVDGFLAGISHVAKQGFEHSHASTSVRITQCENFGCETSEVK